MIGNSYLVVDGEKLSVTISIGATLFGENDTIDSLIRRAEECLYRSKAKGRNRLTLGQTIPVVGVPLFLSLSLNERFGENRPGASSAPQRINARIPPR